MSIRRGRRRIGRNWRGEWMLRSGMRRY